MPIFVPYQVELDWSCWSYLQARTLQAQVWELDLMQTHLWAKLAPARVDSAALQRIAGLFVEAAWLQERELRVFETGREQAQWQQIPQARLRSCLARQPP